VDKGLGLYQTPYDATFLYEKGIAGFEMYQNLNQLYHICHILKSILFETKLILHADSKNWHTDVKIKKFEHEKKIEQNVKLFDCYTWINYLNTLN
jgi:hypothetical protein